MVDADNNEQTPEMKKGGDGLDQLASFKSELDQKLSEVQQQLLAINSQFSAAQAARNAPANEEVTDEDIFEPKKLEAKMTAKATAIAERMIKEEQRKSAVIYELAKDYPEIQSDVQLQAAVREAQKTLPEGMRDTAEGYEMAVLKAVAKQGILPKSKRQQISSGDDFSMESRGVGNRARQQKKAKASSTTRAFAEFLRGRTLTEEESKRLDEAAARTRYNRYE